MSKSKFWPDVPEKRRRWLLVSVGLLTVALALRWFREVQMLSATPLTSWEREVNADCAVVLTGGPGRVREGFDLLVDHRVKKLIVSGVHPDARLRELLPMWPFYDGLREEDVVLEKRSETTWGNAQQSLPIVEALRCRDVVLVTSRLHMPRAFRTFRSVFPGHVRLYPQTVVGSRFHPPFWEAGTEAAKSLFYALWAY